MGKDSLLIPKKFPVAENQLEVELERTAITAVLGKLGQLDKRRWWG